MSDKSKNNSDQLLLYLKGQLPDDDRYDLEQHLLRDPAAKAALEGLRESGLTTAELQDDLKDIRGGWRNQSSTFPRWWTYAAAIAVILLTLWAAWGYYQDQASSRLYASYFAQSNGNENYLVLRGGETTIPGLNPAVAAYQAGNYEESWWRFQELREAYPFDGLILRYSAMSAMQRGDFYAAEAALEQSLSVNTSPKERAAAHWYLALVYLQLDQEQKALPLLQNLVAQDEGMYVSQANQLLQDLER